MEYLRMEPNEPVENMSTVHTGSMGVEEPSTNRREPNESVENMSHVHSLVFDADTDGSIYTYDMCGNKFLHLSSIWNLGNSVVIAGAAYMTSIMMNVLFAERKLKSSKAI